MAVADLHQEAPVLGNAALGNVHVGENLDARHQERGQLRRNMGQFAEHTVHADAHHRAQGLRFDVDVAGLFGGCRRQDGRDQAHRRGLLIAQFGLEFLHRRLVPFAGTGGEELHVGDVNLIDEGDGDLGGDFDGRLDLLVAFLDRFLDFGAEAEPRNDVHAGNEAQLVERLEVLRFRHDGHDAAAFAHQRQHQVFFRRLPRNQFEDGLLDGGKARIHVLELRHLFESGDEVLFADKAARVTGVRPAARSRLPFPSVRRAPVPVLPPSRACAREGLPPAVFFFVPTCVDLYPLNNTCAASYGERRNASNANTCMPQFSHYLLARHGRGRITRTRQL